MNFWIGLIAAFIGVLVGMITVYKWGVANGLEQARIDNEQGAHPDTGGLVAVEETKYQGWFGDFDLDGTIRLSEEPEVHVRFEQRNSNSYQHAIVDKTIGKIYRNGNEVVNHEWTYLGFRSGDYLAFSYASGKMSNNGIGICMLKATGHGFEGFWIGRDTGNLKIVWGPYLLLENSVSEEEVRKKFAIIKCEPRATEFEDWTDFCAQQASSTQVNPE